MEQTVRQLQGDIPLKQQIIRNKIRSADKIQDHFSEQILERTQRVIFNIEIGGKLPAENLRAVFSIPTHHYNSNFCRKKLLTVSLKL